MLKVNQKKKKKTTRSRDIDSNDRKTYTLQDIIRVPFQLLFDPKYFWHLTAILLLGELVLNTLIIHKISCKVFKISIKYVLLTCFRYRNRLGSLYARSRRVYSWRT